MASLRLIRKRPMRALAVAFNGYRVTPRAEVVRARLYRTAELVRRIRPLQRVPPARCNKIPLAARVSPARKFTNLSVTACTISMGKSNHLPN
jgi:hypothetical protein